MIVVFSSYVFKYQSNHFYQTNFTSQYIFHINKNTDEFNGPLLNRKINGSIKKYNGMVLFESCIIIRDVIVLIQGD